MFNEIITIGKIAPIIIILIFCYFLIKKYIGIFGNIFYFYPKNTSKYIKIIKNKYDIKSTEKTKINNISNLKLIVKKPNYFKFNSIKNEKMILNLTGKNNELEHYIDNKNNEKIICLYIYNKNIFKSLFFNSDEHIIKDLESFNEFQKKSHSIINYNILIKFFNNFNENEYLYLYVDKNNLVKIINNEDFDNIANLIENKNNIFLIQENNESKDNINNYITYGDYIEDNVTKKQIKKIFFPNANEKNKNFITLKKFNSIKIYFYVSTLLK